MQLPLRQAKQLKRSRRRLTAADDILRSLWQLEEPIFWMNNHEEEEDEKAIYRDRCCCLTHRTHFDSLDGIMRIRHKLQSITSAGSGEDIIRRYVPL